MRAQSNRKPAPLTKAVGDGYSGAERSVARIINQGWDIMDTGLMQDRAMQMLEASSTEGFLNALPWTQFAEHLGQTVEPISGAVGRAISEELGTIGHAGAKLSLTSVDALSHKYAQEQAGQLIRNISDSQRNTIRGILANAQAGNYTVDQAAREIRKGIGLHPAWANAVTNYENRLSAQPAPKGYSANRWQQTIDKRVARYREQLIRKRSYNIARTEIITAENLGVYATWSQAIGSGAADVNSRKEWAPGPGACRICERLSGEIVGWDAPFSNGAMMPPAHPSCRCSANLLPPEYTTPGLNPRNINWTDPAGDRVAGEGFDAGAGRGILDGMSAEPAAADVADEFGYGGTSDGADTYGEDLDPQAAAQAIDKDFVRGTEEENRAAGLYLGGARYNAALRSGNEIDEFTQERIDQLTRYINQQPPLPAGTSLWRGMGGSYLPADQVFVGAELNEPAFMSTSLSQDEARLFTGQGNNNVLMEIKPRVEDRGLSINHATAPDQSRVPEEYRQQFHAGDREAEILLKPDTTIRVTEVETRTIDGYEVRYIKGEIVDGAETPTIEIPAAAELPKMSAYERDLQAMQQAATATKADQLTYESTLHWSEDKLMAQITKYEDDPEAIDKIFEIIDQRAAAEDAKLAAQEAAQASYNAAQAAKEAARIEEAAMREAGTLRTEESPALNPAVREERGLNAYHRAGEEFQHYMYSQYSKALDETNGNFFNAANHAAAKKRGYDEIDLFSGPYRIAKKYASEELLRFWEAEGRETLGSFRYKLLGRPSDRKAFDTVVREGLGRKAASYDRSNL